MDICHNSGQAKDAANTDDNTFKVVILFWNRLFSGSGHLNLTGRNFPLRPVSRAGQQNNFQIGLFRDFKREFALPVCGSLNELFPLWIRNDDFTRLYFFLLKPLDNKAFPLIRIFIDIPFFTLIYCI